VIAAFQDRPQQQRAQAAILLQRLDADERQVPMRRLRMKLAHLPDELEHVALPRSVHAALDDRDQLRFIGLDAGRQPQCSARTARNFERALCRERLATERTDEFGEDRQVVRSPRPTPAAHH